MHLPRGGVVVLAVERDQLDGVGALIRAEQLGQPEQRDDAGAVVEGAGRAVLAVDVREEDDPGRTAGVLARHQLEGLGGVALRLDAERDLLAEVLEQPRALHVGQKG